MKQVIDKVNACHTPNDVNRLINGELISVKRDNPNNRNNFGKEVYLKTFDAKEIAAGQSRYQIVRQPRFIVKSKWFEKRNSLKRIEVV